MKKYKWLTLCLVLFCFALFLLKTAPAEAATTFPADSAGISAYAKLSGDSVNLQAFADAFDSIEQLQPTYVIGKITVANAAGNTNPHIYVGADGWIVAYYLKTEEASRIMQWLGYTAGSINTTTLKDALDSITQKAGAAYSLPVKYYDFEFPEANKMTLVVDSNDFYATVPGTIFEASYNVIMPNGCASGFDGKVVRLLVDETIVFEAWGGGYFSWWGPFNSYAYYSSSVFNSGVTHHIVKQADCYTFHATVVIYKN